MNETIKARALPRRTIAVAALLAGGFVHLGVINFVLGPQLARSDAASLSSGDGPRTPSSIPAPNALPPSSATPVVAGAGAAIVHQPALKAAGGSAPAQPPVVASAPELQPPAVEPTGMGTTGAGTFELEVPAASQPLLVTFATGAFSLPAEDEAVIDEAVARWKAAPHRKLRLVGHADSRGASLQNHELSRKRALHVAAVVHRAGVPMSHIEIEAEGDRIPRVDEETPEAWALNRRVEILLR